jgi:hypothetical protein
MTLFWKFITALIFINAVLFSQTKVPFTKHVSLYAGMGIDYGITPQFNDYLIAAIPYSTSDSIKSFNAGVEFFGGAEIDLSRNFSAAVDYSYYIRSLTYTYSPAVFDYSITSHQPYVKLNYVIRENRYNFKIGVSAGYHFQSVDNRINASTTEKYRSSGPALRLELTFVHRLSPDFFVYLSGFGFSNFYGKLKDENGNPLKAANSSVEADLAGYGLGGRLGVQFYIGKF